MLESYLSSKQVLLCLLQLRKPRAPLAAPALYLLAQACNLRLCTVGAICLPASKCLHHDKTL